MIGLQGSVTSFIVGIAIIVTYLVTTADIEPAPVTYPNLRPLPLDYTALEDVEILFADDPSFKGPESFVFEGDGSFYTGLSDGRIVKVTAVGTPSYQTIARTGRDHPECGSLALEPMCGRPLGMRAHPLIQGSLLVADAYFGILRVDTTNGHVETLVNPQVHNLTLTNDLDVMEQTIFFTQTGRFPRNQIHKNLIEARPTGAIYALDLVSGEARKVVPEVIMPNGLTVTHDRDALLVTTLEGIVRIDLPQRAPGGSFVSWALPLKAVLVQNDLQGTPDNIRRASAAQKTYWVALGSKRASPFALPQFLAPYISLRKLVSLLPLEVLTAFIPKSCLAVEIDYRGSVLRTFRDKTATCYWLSELESYEGYIWLGSWRTPFLARAKLALDVGAPNREEIAG